MVRCWTRGISDDKDVTNAAAFVCFVGDNFFRGGVDDKDERITSFWSSMESLLDELLGVVFVFLGDFLPPGEGDCLLHSFFVFRFSLLIGDVSEAIILFTSPSNIW